MKIIYTIKKDKIKTEDAKTITVYGISVKQQSFAKTVVLKSVSDVFTNKKHALKYIKLFNKEKLSPIHLECVVEDILAL